MYGPSASTGIGAAAAAGGTGTFLGTGGNILLAALAVFVLIGAVFAAKRALPKWQKH